MFGSGYLYGCREVRFKPAGGSWHSLLTPIDFTFNEVPNSNELNAGDVTVAVHTTTKQIEWELNFGGLLLDQIAALTGRTLGTSGTTPNRKGYMTASQSDAFAYFELWVRVVADDGSAGWVDIKKAQLTQAPNGQFRQNEFFVTNVKGKGVADSNGDFYTTYDLETDAALTTLS
jgi:hypothetical protein